MNNNYVSSHFGIVQDKHQMLTDLSDSDSDHIFTPESSPSICSFKADHSKSKLILPPLLIGSRGSHSSILDEINNNHCKDSFIVTDTPHLPSIKFLLG